MNVYRIAAPLLLMPLLLYAGGCERPPTANKPDTAAEDDTARQDREQGLARVKHARDVMGTFAEVTAYDQDRETARRAVEAAYARLDDVNRLMSDYTDQSEIGRLNGLRANEHLVVSPETFHSLQEAARIAELSGGAFDVTCRPLVRLWKRAGKTNRLPTEAELAAVRQRIGWQNLKLDPETQTVTPMVDGLQVDLGGIAKGYALDLAAEAMQRAGVTRGLVDVGGDVRVVGPKPDESPWRIGVRHPLRGNEEMFCVLEVKEGAVATSGPQFRYVEIEGKRYSHIVDPRTGRPAEQASSVTVIAPDGLTADAWATVFSVLTATEGQAMLDRGVVTGVEVLWILDDHGKIVTHQTPGFAAYIRK